MSSILIPFAEGIWIANGSPVSSFGFRYPIRMAILRLSDQSLFTWSPIPLSEALRNEVDRLGAVRFIVAPNSLHHLFLHEWKSAYPDAKLYGSAELQKRRSDLSFDGELCDTLPAPWAPEIQHVRVGGNVITPEFVFFHHLSKTTLFTDLLQNFEEGWFTGWRALVAGLDDLVGSQPRVPRKFRMAFVNRRAAKDAVERIKAWPSERILMAHGTPIEKEGRAFIGDAFRWLTS